MGGRHDGWPRPIEHDSEASAPYSKYDDTISAVLCSVHMNLTSVMAVRHSLEPCS